jgi:hypothetical protein
VAVPPTVPGPIVRSPGPPAATNRAQTTDCPWWKTVTVRASRWLGSLQVAVLLLPLFALVLFLGTLVESWYDARVAQQLVYQTWWFVTLLGLLGVNIFFAAAKKWPWKRYQTGFLITHVGLLTLITGGILTSLAGTSGQMILVDSDGLMARSYGPHTTSRMIDRNVQTIRVIRPQRNKDEVLSADFEPGPLAWRADEYLEPHTDTVAGVLNWLAHPLPRGWSKLVGDDARLEVLAYYPHARREPYAPAKATAASAFPALQFQLDSPTAGSLPPRWIASHGGEAAARLGPGLVEILGQDCRPKQLDEFRNPPPATQAATKGQLVLGVDGQTYRFDVARMLEQAPQPLGGSGWNLRVLQYVPSTGKRAEPTPADPAVSFELSRTDGPAVGLMTRARRAGELLPLSKDRVPVPLPRDLWAWYHPPDYRYGDNALRAVLQFVTGPDGQLFYRSFSSATEAGFRFEKTGTAEKGAPRQRVWAGMDWKLQVPEFLPRAVAGPYFIPVDRRPGLEDDATAPAIRCRLSKGKEAEEFWVGKTDDSFTPVMVGSEDFLVGFNSSLRDLDFEITLLRAEQTTDRGSSQAASQSSFVLLTDPGQGIHGEARVITLNQPLEHHGYKVYQAGYLALGRDENAKPINRSTLLVRRDPGLWLKYVGSTMLALGVACMFYMKAYFFKPRARS